MQFAYNAAEFYRERLTFFVDNTGGDSIGRLQVVWSTYYQVHTRHLALLWLCIPIGRTLACMVRHNA